MHVLNEKNKKVDDTNEIHIFFPCDNGENKRFKDKKVQIF
jgi:hypothetical protein